MPTDVLVVGAGPTGLVLALWLTRQGLKVRIVDEASGPGQQSRALAVQARTLELYRQAGLTDAVIAGGWQAPAVNLWVSGAPKARIAFADFGAGLTPYPFLHIFPQDAHERLLVERLSGLGVEVEWDTALAAFLETADAVSARLRTSSGDEAACEASFVCGCDGARSAVRAGVGAAFPGGAYRQTFYVADIEAAGPAANGELHVDLDESDFLAIFPIDGAGRMRLIGTIRGERADDAEGLKFEDVSRRAIDHVQVAVRQVNWFSTYRVHHRVADRFRKGRAFLLGDAAHIHSPVGGQGMNTGIGDAINLAWKLAAVLRGKAPESLLDSYEIERRAFARRLVATTDRVFTFATAEGRVADFLRTRLAPLVIPPAAGLDAVRDFLFRTVAQITLNYRHGPLAAGRAGAIHGGDRLPWAGGEDDNFGPLAEIGWQVHAYGGSPEPLRDWCAERGMPLHAFGFGKAQADAGLVEGAAYLLRPDTYVALASPSGATDELDRFLAERGLLP